MKIETFIPFLGHSTVNDDFDDQMELAGLKGRPKGDDPTVFVKSANEGFILGFKSSASFAESYPHAPQTPGAYMLVSIYGEVGASDLPFYLDWEMNIDQLSGRLGEPKKVLAANATFLHEGLLLVCRFRDKTMRRMQSATLSLVDVYARQRYGLAVSNLKCNTPTQVRCRDGKNRDVSAVEPRRARGDLRFEDAGSWHARDRTQAWSLARHDQS